MGTGPRAVAVCAVVCLHAGAAAAQSTVMTLAEVLARAREEAPQIVSARLALEETRERLAGASLRFQSNPQIDAALGNRNGPDTRFTDLELGPGQSFEPGARRSARIAGADAAIAQTSAHTEEVTRTVLRLAASAYYRALHANERIKLLNATYELGSGVYLAADRRFNAGDIAVLDVNITRFVGTRQSGARGGGSLEIDRARRRPAAPWSGKRRRQVGEGLRLVPLFHLVK
jgi:outer membrane protein, heavy metal efflux system